MAAGSHWDTDPDLLADWKYEVANGDTLLGYHQWVSNRDDCTDLEED